jgi:hypothetical protein
MQTLSDGNYRSCAILGGSVEVPADCGGRRGECGRGRPRETCGARRQHVGDVRKQRSADLESGDSDGGRGREGEAFVHLCGEVGREKCVGSQTRKWRWSTRLTHRSRSRSRSRSTDWPSVLEQQRLRRYAYRCCPILLRVDVKFLCAGCHASFMLLAFFYVCVVYGCRHMHVSSVVC